MMCYYFNVHFQGQRVNDLFTSPNIVRIIKIEKNEIGGACSAYGGAESRIQGFGMEI